MDSLTSSLSLVCSPLLYPTPNSPQNLEKLGEMVWAKGTCASISYGVHRMNPQISGHFPFKICLAPKRKSLSCEGKEHLMWNSFVWICWACSFICPGAVIYFSQAVLLWNCFSLHRNAKAPGWGRRLPRQKVSLLVAACGYHSD